jgi:hypothetical protein
MVVNELADVATDVERSLREGNKAVDVYVSLGMADCLVFDCTNFRVAVAMLLEFAVKFSEGKPVVMSIYSEGGKMLCIDVRVLPACVSGIQPIQPCPSPTPPCPPLPSHFASCHPCKRVRMHLTHPSVTSCRTTSGPCRCSTRARPWVG